MAAASLLAAACGAGQVTASDGPRPRFAHPTGAEDVVVEVTEEGGFLPAGVALTRLPSLRATGDGRASTLGPQIAIFPPPALPNVVVADVDLQALLQAADEAGLLDDPPDYGEPPVADAPTTTVTITAEGRTVVHAAPALGVGDEVDGLTPDQREARRRLTAFLRAAHGLAVAHGEERYEAPAFAVWAAPAAGGAAGGDDDDGAGGGGVDGGDDGPAPAVVPWPLADVELAGAAGCVVVDGLAATTLRAALADAHQLTRFVQAAVVYEVWARPLLPGDDGCPPGALPTG